MNNSSSPRSIQQIIPALQASDGAGVRIRRSLGSSPATRVDPFLMLDEFRSDSADDYIAGFPPHPHRGFETVTYMLAGRMRHEDHLGNRGDLGPGDVQWMTAGRGIVHSEMPQQEEGLMQGFQLWINLPAKDKMQPAHYRDISAEQVPLIALADGGSVRVIAGSLTIEGQTVQGPATAEATQPIYLDIELPPGASADLPVPSEHNAFFYVYDGTAQIGTKSVAAQNAAVLSAGDGLLLQNNGDSTLRTLLLAGKPIGEPVAQYGPFVMNTHEELEQTLRDYRDGRLTA